MLEAIFDNTVYPGKERVLRIQPPARVSQMAPPHGLVRGNEHRHGLSSPSNHHVLFPVRNPAEQVCEMLFGLRDTDAGHHSCHLLIWNKYSLFDLVGQDVLFMCYLEIVPSRQDQKQKRP